jgi:GNAT superfamily N-acetyltransferase
MEQIVIRTAHEGDLDALLEFNQAMARETEGKELDSAVLRRGITFLLRNPAQGLYLVAETSGQIAGSLMITYEWSDWRNGLFYWIQSVYVRPENRRAGIYRALYNSVKERARRENVCGFRLYVEKGNSVAQRTYESLGMQESHYLMYEESCEVRTLER